MKILPFLLLLICCFSFSRTFGQNTGVLIFTDQWFNDNYGENPMLPISISKKGIASIEINISKVSNNGLPEEKEAKLLQEFDTLGRLIKQVEIRYIDRKSWRRAPRRTILSEFTYQNNNEVQLHRLVEIRPGKLSRNDNYSIIEKQVSATEKITEFYRQKLQGRSNPYRVNWPPPPPPPPPATYKRSLINKEDSLLKVRARVFHNVEKDSILSLNTYLPCEKNLHMIVISKSFSGLGKYQKGDFFYTHQRNSNVAGLTYFRLYHITGNKQDTIVMSERIYDYRDNMDDLLIIEKVDDPSTGVELKTKLPVGSIQCQFEYKTKGPDKNWLVREMSILNRWNKSEDYKQIHRRRITFHEN